ncbi:MAG: DUF4926 domain-containing protein [Bacteroidetes bacterium]|nr:DUF4926 domain-containing protein [Bacteroidota bacterium]MBS1685105.1 DUF4926 domain-containing protein [Bacteroidota bacterium]
MDKETIELFDVVVLLEDMNGTPFKKGDRATVVEIYDERSAFELEFFDEEGRTLGVEPMALNKDKPEPVKLVSKNRYNK